MNLWFMIRGFDIEYILFLHFFQMEDMFCEWRVTEQLMYPIEGILLLLSIVIPSILF